MNDVQSQSSVSSDYGDEEVSENEAEVQHVGHGESSPVPCVDVYCPGMMKEIRAMTYGNVENSTALNVPVEVGTVVITECSHVYMLKEGGSA